MTSSELTQNLVPVEWANRRVLLTKQIAEAYGVPVVNVQQNFRNAKKQFVEGVHYFTVGGEQLRELKAKLREAKVFCVAQSVSHLYLWTEQGAARHCKMINTQAAWNVFNELEATYFNEAKPLCLPKPAACDREGAKILARLAAAACTPEIKDKLAMKAANLLLGEEFFPAARLAGAKVSASVPLG